LNNVRENSFEKRKNSRLSVVIAFLSVSVALSRQFDFYAFNNLTDCLPYCNRI